MSSRRTLIVFAKLPRPGEVKTRLGFEIGMDQACATYDAFAQHAFSLAEKVMEGGISVSVHFVNNAPEAEIKRWVGRPFSFFPQQGATLGDRMENAFHKAFDDGAAQAVIIGTDVPELDSTTVMRGFEQLDTHDITIGPSSDGGYYLLGMRSPGYDVFSGIQWSTERVYTETLRHIEHMRLRYAVLPVFSDIDTLEQYEAFRRRTQRQWNDG